MLIRTMGNTDYGGLLLAIGLRSGWRKASVFAACVVPFVGRTPLAFNISNSTNAVGRRKRLRAIVANDVAVLTPATLDFGRRM